MKLLISLLFVFSTNVYADFYGCNEAALDYAVEQAVKKTGKDENVIRSIAEVEEVYLDDTYGTGEFIIKFFTLQYNVSVTIFGNDDETEYACEVNESDSYEL